MVYYATNHWNVTLHSVHLHRRLNNGAYAFEQISNTLNIFGVTSRINGGYNGLKCEHWVRRNPPLTHG